MKSFISIILSLVLTSVYAIDRRPPNVPFDPVVSQFGFQTTDGVFSGNGSDLFNVNPKSGSEMTNMSFFTSSGIVIGGLDGNGTFTLSDTNYLFAVSFDPTVPQFFITDTNLTEKFKVLGSLLYLDNPIIVGSLTGNGSGLSNAFAIAAGDSSVTLVTNANGRLVTITSTGGSGTGIATNGGSGINNLFTNASMKNIFLYDITGSVYNQFTTYNTAVFSLGVLAVTNGQLSYFGGSGLLSVKLDTTNVLASAGSSLNQVGITNGNVTIPGNIDVAGTFNVGTANVTNLTSVATGNTNRMPVWGPNGNLTNVSLVNLTLDTGVFPATLTASGSIDTTGATPGSLLRATASGTGWRSPLVNIGHIQANGLTTFSYVGLNSGTIVPGTAHAPPATSTANYSVGYSTNAAAIGHVIYNTGGFNQIALTTNFYFGLIGRVTNTANVRVIFGAAATTTPLTSQSANQNGVYFRYSTNSANWFLITANGSSQTASDTGIAADTSFHTFELYNTDNSGTNFSGRIDGSQCPTNSMINPSGQTSHMFGLCALETAVKAIEVRRVYYESQ